MPDLNILITAASSATAYKLEKQISGADKIVLADDVDLPQILLKGKNFIKIPSGASSAFSHQLLSICLDLEIDKVYPLKRAEILALAEVKQLFEEYGITLMIPDLPEIQTLLGDLKSGEIVLNENEDAYSGRGVYLVRSEDSSNFQLLTAD